MTASTDNLSNRLTIEIMKYSFEIPETASTGEFSSLSNIIQFDQCIQFLERGGKILFGKQFSIHPEDYKTVFLLLIYFYRDLENIERFELDLKKGILLQGPVGCGKTSLLFLMRLMLPKDEQFTIISARDIGLEFVRDGYSVIEKYSTKSFVNSDQVLRPKAYCLDDLGLEAPFKHFGNETNVIGEILLSRYPLFTYQRMKTHATTNLSAAQLEKVYGNRIRSRMREMFNLISFDSKSVDKRT